MSVRIERSHGHFVTAGFASGFAGGGTVGLTEELDDAVMFAAQLMVDAFERDVEVRFNSDRCSGGAWLKDGRTDFLANDQVGLKATRINSPEDMDIDTWLNMPRSEQEAYPYRIVIGTRVEASALKDPSVAASMQEGLRGEPVFAMSHETVQDAMDWLRANVKRSGLRQMAS